MTVCCICPIKDKWIQDNENKYLLSRQAKLTCCYKVSVHCWLGVVLMYMFVLLHISFFVHFHFCITLHWLDMRSRKGQQCLQPSWKTASVHVHKFSRHLSLWHLWILQERPVLGFQREKHEVCGQLIEYSSPKGTFIGQSDSTYLNEIRNK